MNCLTAQFSYFTKMLRKIYLSYLKKKFLNQTAHHLCSFKQEGVHFKTMRFLFRSLRGLQSCFSVVENSIWKANLNNLMWYTSLNL